MTQKDFMNALVDYYGDFKSKVIAKAVYEELKTVQEADFESLYKHIIRTQSSAFPPDVKTVSDSKKALDLKPPEKDYEICPNCGKLRHYAICEWCYYDPEIPVEEFRRQMKAGCEAAASLKTQVENIFKRVTQ